MSKWKVRELDIHTEMHDAAMYKGRGEGVVSIACRQ